ncbi:MAG: dockerin type I repeat-containing protein [Prevotella sp.]|nr:dockerin type I repeat-containing protein [Prevotella sp.]
MKRTRFFLQSAVILLVFMTMALPTWGIFNPVDPYLYPNNMTMVIQLKNGEQIVDTCEVAAFIGGECRAAERAERGLYFLLIPGDGGGQTVEIRTCLNDKIVTIDNSIVFESDMNIGWPKSPYVIDISEVLSGKIKGDVNGDGAVDVADIASIIDVMAGATVPGASVSGAADVNGDGTVDVADIASVIDIMSASARRF